MNQSRKSHGGPQRGDDGSAGSVDNAGSADNPGNAPRRWPFGPRSLVLVGLLTGLGIVTHMLPHPMGVSTAGAVGMLCAAYLSPRLMLLPVFLTVAVVDVIYGNAYGSLAMAPVYVGHLVGALAVSPILRSVRATRVVGAAVVSALAFYLVSNLTPMLMGFYPATPTGWMQCYVNGLPFLARGVLANLVFGGLAFGAVALWVAPYAHRFAPAQRH